MTDSLNQLLARVAIQDTLNAYAAACDRRDWSAFDDIFLPQVSVNYGGAFELEGREAVVGMIRSMLGGCGPTQHLLGNFDIRFDGDLAHSTCYVRAVHAGLGGEAETYYEVWARYVDTLVETDGGWRIAERAMEVDKEVGSRDILKPRA